MAVLSAVVCGVVGTHVVLRGMAFIGDAVAHSVFPGLAVAFLLSGSLVLGGAVAGVTTAVLVALLSQNRRLKEDSVIGVLFVGAFALGVVVISRAPGYAGSLQDFLFSCSAPSPACRPATCRWRSREGRWCWQWWRPSTPRSWP